MKKRAVAVPVPDTSKVAVPLTFTEPILPTSVTVPFAFAVAASPVPGTRS